MEVQEIIKLTKDVTFFLNTGESSEVWKVKDLGEDNNSYPTRYIVNSTNPDCELALYLETYGSNKGKVRISGNFHIGKERKFVEVREWQGYPISGYAPLPTINVSISRGAEKIAGEIKRRFLPEYLPMLAKAQARRDQSQAFYDVAQSNLRDLAKIVNASLKDLGSEQTHCTYSLTGEGYGTIKASDKTINLELNSVSVDKAKRILEIIMEISDLA